MVDMAGPYPAGEALGHGHMLSADQFASRGTSPVSTFSQGFQDGRAQATATHSHAPAQPMDNDGVPAA